MPKQSALPSITIGDITHLKELIGHISQLIGNASKNRIRGTNILLWGPPGTGKTQLALYLGQSLDLTTFEVSNVGNDNENISESDRFCQYQLSQSILEQKMKALLIFDEVENLLLNYSYHDGITKATINAALEENPIPSIWICNSVRAQDNAYLRRFDLVAEIDRPSLPVKRNMAKKTLGSFPLDEDLLDTILKQKEVGPSLLSKISKVGEICEVTESEAANALALTIVNGDLAIAGSPEIDFTLPDKKNTLPSLEYDSGMINTDVDIDQITRHLESQSELRIFLYGPPGSGKTA